MKIYSCLRYHVFGLCFAPRGLSTRWVVSRSHFFTPFPRLARFRSRADLPGVSCEKLRFFGHCDASSCVSGSLDFTTNFLKTCSDVLYLYSSSLFSRYTYMAKETFSSETKVPSLDLQYPSPEAISSSYYLPEIFLCVANSVSKGQYVRFHSLFFITLISILVTLFRCFRSSLIGMWVLRRQRFLMFSLQLYP